MATRSLYPCANDDLGRREWVYRDGTAFAGDHADVWGYNDRNELSNSDRYNTFDPNSPGSPSDPNHAFDRAYGYDPIGNREWSKEGSDPNTPYTANNLNQYTATQDPNESFTYDDDGNLTTDGDFTYTWDAENRLTCVQSGDPNSPVNGDKKIEFVYDFLGRRVEKKVSTHNGTSWSVSDCRRFVWSDWLPVLELDASDPNDVTILRKYTWGLDLSGNSIDSAGGIGGLLATEDVEGTEDYYYLYDANGNVGQVLDGSDGSIAAKYEYDAYGNTLVSTGDFAADNPFRFSTKYWDDEIDLGYWGYRYYSARLGRFLNRDLAGEPGAVLVRMAVALSGFIPRDPIPEQPYTYAVNSPCDWVDPDGWAAQKGGQAPKPESRPATTRPGEKPAGRGRTCGLKIKRSAICTLFPEDACDFGHEWIEGGGGRWDYPKDYGEDPCHEWDRNHPVWEWNAHVKLLGGKLPDGTSCGEATCSQIKSCLQQVEDEWAGTSYNFLSHSCINFVDAALNKCCMARGILPTRMPKPFEELKLCHKRCKWMREHGCCGHGGP